MVDVVGGRKPAASRGVASYVRSQIPTVANLFTAFRVLTALEMWYWADDRLTVFVLALSGALSDGADGYLARKLDQVTDFGKRFDQVADFVFGVAVAYVLIRWEGWGWYNAPPIIAIAMYAVIVTGLRSMNLASDSSNMSKWKTGFQFGAIIGIFAGYTFVVPFLVSIGYGVLWCSLLPMAQSLHGYIVEATARR